MKARIAVGHAIFIVLLLAGVLIKRAEHREASLLISNILTAHKLSIDLGPIVVLAEAEKTMHGSAKSRGEGTVGPRHVVTVAIRGNAFRREKRSELGRIQEVVISDGSASYFMESPDGLAAPRRVRLEDWQLENARLAVSTFGIL